MKTSKIVSTISIIAIAVIIGLGMLNFIFSYREATLIADMTDEERYGFYTMDSKNYNELYKSYEFISSLPVIGDTL